MSICVWQLVETIYLKLVIVSLWSTHMKCRLMTNIAVSTLSSIRYIQALFWSAHRRISAHFPRISDPSEISTNLLR